MRYHRENEAKATFDDIYVAPTPHAYVAEMAKHGFQIGEQARPYCTAAAELLREQNGEAWPVQMLDIGCSYGIGSAFVKYGCSFDEIVAFFSSRAPENYSSCCEVMRMWLSVTSPVCDIRCVGLDSSAPAIRFALNAGLLDGGIARDLEQPNADPTEEERAWFRSCNLLVSTGAIGYVTEHTLTKVLPHFGNDHPADFGPYAVVTILRMFDAKPIIRSFEQFGFRFEPVPGACLPQRNFVNEEERSKVLSILHDKGIDTVGREDRGKHFADLFVGAPAEQIPELLERMALVKLECSEERATSYIHR